MIGLCLKYEQVNYGSKLQALATIRLMEELGHEFVIIHYGKKGFLFKVKALPRIFNPAFRQDKMESLSKALAYKRHPEIKECISDRLQLFKKFDKKYFDPFETYGAKYDDIKEIASGLDAVVSCSDQLWSPAGLATNFYNLMFVPDNVRKVSFASSFGVQDIPWYQKKATAHYLNRIEYVSCRENRGAEIVKELTGRSVPVLMDPVFAFNKDQWETIIPTEKAYKEPYVFCYFLGADISHRRAAMEFSKKKGLKIVFLKYLDQYVKYDCDFGDITPFNVDPCLFLNILRGAEYVLTDSFHGCAFSIIMQKQFIVFNRYSTASKASKNSRIDTVCDNLNLTKRRANPNSDIDSLICKKIDWHGVELLLRNYQTGMRNYLRNALSF